MKRILLAIAFLVPLSASADVQIGAGSTLQCFDVTVVDSSASTGAGLTGLAYNSGSLTCYYHRRGASSATSISLVTSTLGTHPGASSGAFKEISSTNMPGDYEFCAPDAAFATGATDVFFTCKGATNMAPMKLRVTLLSPNTFGYDGKLAAKSGTSLTLASGAIDADNQFAYVAEAAFFDSAGLLEGVSCITASVASTEVVTTAEDIAALLTVSDNYIIRANSGCKALRPSTAGRTLDVASTGDAEANLTMVNGQDASTNSGTLKLKQLDVTNSTGDAVVIASTGSNGNGMNISGNGTASGILATGGATGRGIWGKGGSTSGAGIRGEGMGGNSAGIYGVGIGSSPGMHLAGGATGAGLLGVGGATSGAGIRGEGAGTNSVGIYGAGFGSSPGMYLVGGSGGGQGLLTVGQGVAAGVRAEGGATGPGTQLVGGSTSGAALAATNTTGDVITSTAAAGNGSAFVLAGQGSGQGLKATGGATGNGAKFTGGSTSGDGIDTSVTSGVGFDATLSALTATYAQLSACPTATASIPDMIRYIFMLARNKITQTGSAFTVFKDDTTSSLCSASITNASGTFTRNELN